MCSGRPARKAACAWIAIPGASHANAELLDERLSLGVAVVLILVYIANLIYTLYTHSDVFAYEEGHGGEKPTWSLWRSLAVLLAATVAVSL